MLHFALLLDGGFIRRKLGSSSRPATSTDVRALVASITQHGALAGMRLHRAYYYDSAPLEGAEQKPLSGERVDFGRQPTAARVLKLFEELRQEPFLALRLGELAFDGWTVSARKLAKATGPTITIGADDLRPEITQKGVDMRIGMDIAALTLKRQVQVIVLVSGDSDFVPAMKFARREGAQVFLCPLGQHVRPTMLEHSDLLLRL
jgi:uncharacterized LabA/DUF88 family protein